MGWCWFAAFSNGSFPRFVTTTARTTTPGEADGVPLKAASTHQTRWRHRVLYLYFVEPSHFRECLPQADFLPGLCRERLCRLHGQAPHPQRPPWLCCDHGPATAACSHGTPPLRTQPTTLSHSMAQSPSQAPFARGPSQRRHRGRRRRRHRPCCVHERPSPTAPVHQARVPSVQEEGQAHCQGRRATWRRTAIVS